MLHNHTKMKFSRKMDYIDILQLELQDHIEQLSLAKTFEDATIQIMGITTKEFHLHSFEV